MNPFSIRNASFVFALIAAGPASALSCAAPSIMDTYAFADQSAEPYVMGVGSFDVVGQSMPPEGAVALDGDINNMQGYTQPGQFIGMRFTSWGFNQPWTEDVLVEVSCMVAWCGQAERVENGLFFFRQNADGTYALEMEPCPGNVFHNPTGNDLRQVRDCYNSGDC